MIMKDNNIEMDRIIQDDKSNSIAEENSLITILLDNFNMTKKILE